MGSFEGCLSQQLHYMTELTISRFFSLAGIRRSHKQCDKRRNKLIETLLRVLRWWQWLNGGSEKEWGENTGSTKYTSLCVHVWNWIYEKDCVCYKSNYNILVASVAISRKSDKKCSD